LGHNFALYLRVELVYRDTGFMSHGLYALRSRLLWWLW